MVIYELWDPLSRTHAQASVVGTWSDDRGLCPKCGVSKQVIVPPLAVSWRPNGKIVGDFTWVVWAAVVSHRAGSALLEKCRGFQLLEVEVISADTTDLVYPAGTEPLHHLDVTARVDPLPASTIEMKECSECGNVVTYITGIEQRRGDWDPKTMTMLSSNHRRVPGNGLLVNEDDVEVAGIFGLRGPSRFIFCTEAVKEFIEARGFTNCGFREVGETRTILQRH